MSALATLGAAGLSAASAYAVNQANLKNQRKVNDISTNLANTAHQREVADLKLAGLNPILSAQGSGASTPSLQSATVDNPVAGLADSVNSALNGHQRREVQREQVAQIKQSTDNQALVNEQMALETDAIRAEAAERVSSARNAKLENDMSYGAVMRYLYGKDAYTFDGSRIPSASGVRVFSPSRLQNASDLYQQRWEASLKDATNLNWRNNLRAITGGASSAASAASALRGRRK